MFDYFYEKDLFAVMKYYMDKYEEIHGHIPAKELNMVYYDKVDLVMVAMMINELSDYRVPINIQTEGEGK